MEKKSNGGVCVELILAIRCDPSVQMERNRRLYWERLIWQRLGPILGLLFLAGTVTSSVNGDEFTRRETLRLAGVSGVSAHAEIMTTATPEIFPTVPLLLPNTPTPERLVLSTATPEAPRQLAVTLLGSSSMEILGKNWERGGYASLFPNMLVTRGGIGGADIPLLRKNIDRLVPNGSQDVIVIYCAQNDLIAGQAVKVVYANFLLLIADIRQRNPNATLVVVAPMPTENEERNWFNRQQREYRALLGDGSEAGVSILDLSSFLRTPDGELNAVFYQPDKLHLSDLGYQNVFIPAVKDQIEMVMRERAAKQASH